MHITICKTDDHLHQLLKLQKENHRNSLPKDDYASNGFLSVTHSFDVLKKMNEEVPQVIALDDQVLAGYALVMTSRFKDAIPELIPLFDQFDHVLYQGKPISSYRYYVMGQICVGKDFRGKGVFDLLYKKHKSMLQNQYDLCVTEISTSNIKSMSAHKRVGFENVYTYSDDIDEWNIVVWNWMR